MYNYILKSIQLHQQLQVLSLLVFFFAFEASTKHGRKSRYIIQTHLFPFDILYNHPPPKKKKKNSKPSTSPASLSHAPQLLHVTALRLLQPRAQAPPRHLGAAELPGVAQGDGFHQEPSGAGRAWLEQQKRLKND